MPAARHRHHEINDRMNLLLSALMLLSFLVSAPGKLGTAVLQEEPKTAGLKVKIGDEVRDFGPVEITGKITVEKLMRDLAERDEDFQFESQGKGETFFVTSVLGKTNEGRGGRNWVFRVNDQLAKRGAGTLEIGAGAVVTWEFRGRADRSP